MDDRTTQRSIGRRVRAAREAKSWTQDQLTVIFDLNDRQSVSDIEKGKRALKPDELLLLASRSGRDVEFFLDPFVVAGEAEFSWRASDPVLTEQLDRFEDRAGRWVGLLRWLRDQRTDGASVLKRSLRLSTRATFEEAQAGAESLARELGLGSVPADGLVEKIESDLEIPVLYIDPIDGFDPSAISGATCHLDDLSVILINRHESEGRRNYDLAHELFHALTWDAMKPDHREPTALELTKDRRPRRVEQLADNFAAALLMPRATVNSMIDADAATDAGQLQNVATTLRVSLEALLWRLVALKMIDRKDVRPLLSKKNRQLPGETPKPFSLQFVRLLGDAIDCGRLSARKAAKTLGLSLEDLTALFAAYDQPVPFDL